MRRGRRSWRADDGYMMAALLVALAVLSIMLSVALPVHSTQAKRERELELIFRGQQYARAIELYQRKYPNVFPPSIEVLLEQRFLRKRYRDPMTEDGAFVIVRGGLSRMDLTNEAGRMRSGVRPDAVLVHGGINGVMSSSKERAVREYKGFRQYNEWVFVHVPRAPGPKTGRAATPPASSDQRPRRLSPSAVRPSG
jgi:type II secretory pathway pseudopilin PulG